MKRPLKAPQPLHKLSSSDGFTLVEALVTLVIMSIGMLGLAAMQSASIRFAYDSYLRTQTSFLAADLFDRMRANPSVNYVDLEDTTSTDCSDSTANCDPITMMQYDLTQWTNQGNALFPDAEIQLNSPAPFNTYTISFKWSSRTTDGGQVGEEDNRQTLTYVARVKE